MIGELWRPVLIQVVLILVAASSALQIGALRNGFEGLSWPFGSRHKRVGYLLAGLLLVLVLLGGLFLEREDTTLPPLSLLVVLLAGIGLALVAQIVGAALRLTWNKKRRWATVSRGKPISLGPVQATFYQPTGRGPFSALCLLPDPTVPGDNLTDFAQALVESNIATLVLDWRSLDNPDRLTLQGLVAVGISHLTRWPETDAGRVGLAGVGLGGDLALRGAAADAGVAVVLALEPVLANRRPGLGLTDLHDLSWFEARKRAHAWRHSALVKELDALTAVRAIGNRPISIVTGLTGNTQTIDSLEILRTEEGCSLVSAAQAEKVGCAVAWLKEHLS